MKREDKIKVINQYAKTRINHRTTNRYGFTQSLQRNTQKPQRQGTLLFINLCEKTLWSLPVRRTTMEGRRETLKIKTIINNNINILD